MQLFATAAGQQDFHACEVRGMLGRDKQRQLILDNVTKMLDVGLYI